MVELPVSRHYMRILSSIYFIELSRDLWVNICETLGTELGDRVMQIFAILLIRIMCQRQIVFCKLIHVVRSPRLFSFHSRDPGSGPVGHEQN